MRHLLVPSRLRTVVALQCLLLTAVLGGCSDDTGSGSTSKVDPAAAAGLPTVQFNSFTDIDTALSETKTKAGTSVKVTCTAMPGSVVVPKPTFAVSPMTGVEINGDTIKSTKTGTFTVTCTLNNANKVSDKSPVLLTVVAGPAKELTATVAPTQAAAGSQAQVSCSGKDAYGNVIGKDGEAFTTETVPPELASASGLTLTAKKVGKGGVRCKTADMLADVQYNDAAFEVVAGPPAKTKATVTPDKLVAGEGSADVSCSAEDAQGNAVAATGFTIDPPKDLTLSGTKVSTTKSGTYEIKCGLPGVTEQVAAKLVVSPAAPVSFALGVEPKKPIYATGDTVKVMSLEADKYGNINPVWLKKDVTAQPAESVTVNGGGLSYDLAQDGTTTFSYTHPTLKTVDGSASASVTIKVDSTGPMMMISTPKRGETRDGNPVVEIKGLCMDELSALKSLTINKKDIKVGGDGSYVTTMDSQLGMNVILWEAEDEWGNKSAGVQTYYYSTKWYPNDTAKPNDAAVSSGIGFWMSQATIDAGPPHNHKQLKDLASIAEVVIGTIDLKGLLGAAGFPINQGINGLFKVKDIAINNIKFGDKTINEGYPELYFTVIQGGLHINAKIHKLEILLQLNVETFGQKGWQEFIATSDWINIETDLMMSLDPATKKPVTSLKNTKLKIQDFKVNLTPNNNLPPPLNIWVSQGSNAIIGLVTSFLGGPLTGLIEQVLQDQIQKQLGDTLGSAFAALAINTELPLKPFIGGGEEVKLKLASNLGLLDFKANEGVLAGLDASMTAPKKVPHTVLGSIGRAACLNPAGKDIFNPALKYALEVGLADDFVNQLLHGLWNGGLLQLKIGAETLGAVDLTQFGVADLSVETDFLLQPIVNTCLTKDGTLKLQIGDLGIHAKLKMGDTPIDIYLYATLQATAELKAVENPTTKQKEIGFALKSVDFIELEVEKINAEAKGMKDLFVTLIKGVMVPKLLESLGSGLGAFPLPELDLSGISPAVPPGTKFAIDVQSITNDAGYTYLRGKLK